MEAVSHGFSNAELETTRLEVAAQIQRADESAYQHAIDSNLLHELLEGKQVLFSAGAEVVTDEPSKLDRQVATENQVLLNHIDDLVRGATSEVIVMTPYFVPGEDGVEFWRAIVDSGVRVVIVTNSLASNNHVAVHSAYSKYRKSLIAAGVELYEARADAVSIDESGASEAESLTLHTKSMLIDREQLFVGSLNLDPRSIEINSEMGLIIQSSALGELMAAHFMDDLHHRTYRVEFDGEEHLQWRGTINGVEVIETSEPLASAWLRFKAWFQKIAPESQL